MPRKRISVTIDQLRGWRIWRRLGPSAVLGLSSQSPSSCYSLSRSMCLLSCLSVFLVLVQGLSSRPQKRLAPACGCVPLPPTPPLAIVSAIAPPSHLVFTCIFSHLISSRPFSRRRVFAYAPHITSSPFVGVSVWHSSSSVAFPPLCPLFPSPRVSSVLSPAHSAWSGCRV